MKGHITHIKFWNYKSTNDNHQNNYILKGINVINLQKFLSLHCQTKRRTASGQSLTDLQGISAALSYKKIESY
jgi:hypothetical protein